MEETNIKENITTDVLVNLQSFLVIADSYVEQNSHINEVFHLGLIIDKMQEDIEKLKPYYSILETSIV